MGPPFNKPIKGDHAIEICLRIKASEVGGGKCLQGEARSKSLE